MVLHPSRPPPLTITQAITAWFYIGQPELTIMLNCPGSVAQALTGGAEGEGSEEAAAELVARVMKAVL